VSSDAFASVSPKQGGARAAAEAIQRVTGLETVPDNVCPHYDAVVVEAVAATPDLRLIGVEELPRGTRVEIKSVIVVYASGARGRFYFRPKQHAHLLDNSGVYLLVVCEPTPDRAVLSMVAVSAQHVGDQLPDWFNGGDGRSDYAQLSWSNFIDPEEVARR
jgi:hypothetical protein